MPKAPASKPSAPESAIIPESLPMVSLDREEDEDGQGVQGALFFLLLLLPADLLSLSKMSAAAAGAKDSILGCASSFAALSHWVARH